MATIKDVAALAGVSISTVSFVLNGKADEKKIAKKTCDKVCEAAVKLGYKPNSSARKLRSAKQSRPVIALFWPMDYRLSYLTSILDGLRRQIIARNLDCDLIISTYRNDYLHEEKDLEDNMKYDIAIIGATSPKDLEYLSALKTSLPIILFNRRSDKYSYVYADEEKSIYNLVEILASKGHENLYLLQGNNSYIAADHRFNAILKACSKHNVVIDAENIIRVEDSFDGGALGARKLLSINPKPKILMCMSDMLGLGASHYLIHNGIAIPDDLELISVGTGDPNVTKYANPSLTILTIPSVEMAAAAIDMSMELLFEIKSDKTHKRSIASSILFRESFTQ